MIYINILTNLIKVRSNEILLDQYNHPQQIYVKDAINSTLLKEIYMEI